MSSKPKKPSKGNFTTSTVNVKVKVILEEATKTQKRSRGIALLFL